MTTTVRYSARSMLEARRLLLAPALLLAACGTDAPLPPGSPEAPKGHPAAAVFDAGLEAPSAVLYDRRADVYLVSNAGRPEEGDAGGGFVSRVDPDGSVRELRWIAPDNGVPGVTLDAPEGLALLDDTLYVADGSCLRLFHRERGTPLRAECLPDAVHLTGVAAGPDGTLYVTDDGGRTGSGGGEPGGRVYTVLPGGTVSTVLNGAGVDGPRGIASTERGVFFASFGRGSVSQVTPDGPRRVLGRQGWSLDGLVFTEDGSFAFSSWSDSTVLFVRASDAGARGEVFTLLRHVSSPGALGYDARRGRILVPQRDVDRLFFVGLTPAGEEP